MIRRLPVSPSSGSLEEYAARFDSLFRPQRDDLRRYLEGLLLTALKSGHKPRALSRSW